MRWQDKIQNFDRNVDWNQAAQNKSGCKYYGRPSLTLDKK